MPYAQTNYKDIQGINGKYSIASIGCFITAFCNLLERKGVEVDPPTINAWLRDHGTYIDVDDGVRDDVSYSTVTAFNPNLTVAATGTGKPTANEAIVKFRYTSPRTKQFTTHFCLWLGDDTILDSWDGKVKKLSQTSYGQPIAWATYNFKTAEVVKPVSQYTGNSVSTTKNRFRRLPAPMELQTKRDCNFWFINFTKFSEAKAHHLAPKGERFTAYGVYDHPLKETYYMNEVDFGNADQDGTLLNPLGFNSADLEPYVAPVAPTPVSEPTPALAAPETAVEPVKVPTPPAPVVIDTDVNPDAWKASFTVNAAGDYKANNNVVVTDLEGNFGPRQLLRKKIVEIGGSFVGPDGERYYRTEASVKGNNWYGIPVRYMDKTSDDDLFLEELEEVGQSLGKELEDGVTKVGQGGRQKAIAAIASIEKFFEYLVKFKFLRRKK